VIRRIGRKYSGSIRFTKSFCPCIGLIGGKPDMIPEGQGQKVYRIRHEDAPAPLMTGKLVFTGRSCREVCLVHLFDKA